MRLSRLNPTEPASAKGDDEAHAKATTKYWVPPAKLSAVKLALSRRLPVVLEGGVGPTSPEKASSVTDSQLVNTVYLDSPSLELYHGRLSKTPGAVALRLRWYGAGEPRGMLCVGASVLACYALLTYRWRARHILAKDQPEWGDPQGPLLVTFVVVFMLLSAWVAEMKVWLSSS